MKRILFAALAATLLMFAQKGSAADAFGVCSSSQAQCTALAVELKKVQMAQELEIARPVPGVSFLCAPDTPDCCPPLLMPLCSANATVIIDQTLLSMHQNDAAKCPWSPAICERMGAYWCGPDGGWTPWGGCSDPVAVPLPPDFPTCPPGQRWNGKICIDVPCFHPRLGVEMPCGPITDGQVVFDADIAGSTLDRLIQSDGVVDSARKSLVAQAERVVQSNRQ